MGAQVLHWLGLEKLCVIVIRHVIEQHLSEFAPARTHSATENPCQALHMLSFLHAGDEVVMNVENAGDVALDSL